MPETHLSFYRFPQPGLQINLALAQNKVLVFMRETELLICFVPFFSPFLCGQIAMNERYQMDTSVDGKLVFCSGKVRNFVFVLSRRTNLRSRIEAMKEYACQTRQQKTFLTMLFLCTVFFISVL